MASGDTLILLRPFHAEPFDYPATRGLFDIRRERRILSLAVNNEMRFSYVLPSQHAGGGLTIYIHYAMTSATSGNINLETNFERIGNKIQNIDSDGFTVSPQEVGDTAVPTSAGEVDTVTTTHTEGAQMDSLVIGEGFRLNVERVSAASEATGNLEILFIEVKET